MPVTQCHDLVFVRPSPISGTDDNHETEMRMGLLILMSWIVDIFWVRWGVKIRSYVIDTVDDVPKSSKNKAVEMYIKQRK